MRGLTSILTAPHRSLRRPFPLCRSFALAHLRPKETRKRRDGEWGETLSVGKCARGDRRGDDSVVVTWGGEGTREEEKMEESEG